ncbi:hypothetical protein J6590_072069 [Homalodisca vitripennis]|nr:hypothetical protein J6590_072069 [Homalodisca vitripennis]
MVNNIDAWAESVYLYLYYVVGEENGYCVLASSQKATMSASNASNLSPPVSSTAPATCIPPSRYADDIEQFPFGPYCATSHNPTFFLPATCWPQFRDLRNCSCGNNTALSSSPVLYPFQQTDIIVLPGSICSRIAAISIAAQRFGTLTKNLALVSLQSPPNTHCSGRTRPQHCSYVW